ncbi:MAG TPA: PGPGW domain-containing protein [Candidatus Dormibacteraeota bacterium]
MAPIDQLKTMPRAARRAVVVIAAAILLPAGALMLVLPGPGLLVIGAGLGLLAAEFPAVRRKLRRAATIAAALAGRRARGRVAAKGAVRAVHADVSANY